jgi:DHA2 family multidrug resistance protein
VTAKKSFINPRLFLDQNFAVAMIFIFVIGITYLASLALMTPYLQTLMEYPVITAGIVMGPRGLGTMLCMFLVGRLMGKIDSRWLLVLGLTLTAWAMYDMTSWTPDVSQWTIVSVGFIQGAGLGFLFVPLTTIAFSTLPAHMRGDGTGLYNLSRNIGSSVGISIVSALIVENVQSNHESIAAYVTPFNRAFDAAAAQGLSPLTAAGRASLNQVITLQSTIIAYMDDFKLLMLMWGGVGEGSFSIPSTRHLPPGNRLFQPADFHLRHRLQQQVGIVVERRRQHLALGAIAHHLAAIHHGNRVGDRRTVAMSWVMKR